MELLGWQVLQLNEDYVYVRKVPLIGSVAKVQRPQIMPTIAQVKSFSKEHGVAAFYLEPSLNTVYDMPHANFALANNSFVPAKTIHIDLTSSEQTLLENMKHKTRYNIKVAQRHVVIHKSTQIEEFMRMYNESARGRGMWLPQNSEIGSLWKAFGNKAHLLLAHDTTLLLGRGVVKPLGGVLLLESPGAMYYMYAGSTKEGKKLFAPTLLAWEAIRLAKKRKKKIFDFEGVYDERYPSTKTWKGFTKFKEGFGGEVVEYPQTLAYYKNPLIQLLL